MVTWKLWDRAWVLWLVLSLICPTEACQRSTRAVADHNAVRPVTETRLASGWNITNADATSAKFHVKDTFIRDATGRVRLFHGFNSVLKGFPWYSEDLINATKLDLFELWGFNVVRLGAMWSGLQPSGREINTTYLETLANITQRLGDRGIYVILDMHQDVISTMFGSYDGVPKWVLEKCPPFPNRFPWPIPHSAIAAGWASAYLTQACGKAFQCLYDNLNGTLDDMAFFWTTIARRFKNHKNVLGYELINEPWAGDIYARPDLLLPGVAGRINLVPVYDRLNAAIRSVDDDTLLFYEPVTWGVVFGGNRTGSGFSRVPGGAAYNNRSVLSFHYYCWFMDYDHQHRPYATSTKYMCDHILGQMVFDSVRHDVTRIGGGLFLTEFGLCDPDGNPESAATIECDSVMTKADTHLVSWTYWDSIFFINDSINAASVAAFSRPYARAIAGVPSAMEFLKPSNIFTLVYQADPTISAPTEIYLPPDKYPQGFRVITRPLRTWEYSPTKHVLSVLSATMDTSAAVTVTVWPRGQ